MAASLDVPDEEPIELTCETCTWQVSVDPLTSLVSETRVAGALREMGIPVETANAWELPTPTVLDIPDEPRALRFEMTHDGMTVRIDVDGELQLTAVSVTDVAGDDYSAADRF